MKRQYKLNILLQAMLVLFLIGACLIWAYKAQASENHNSSIIYNSYQTAKDSTCAVAGVSGLHQFKQSPKLQGSISIANCDNANAISIGAGQQVGDILYSIVGSVDDVKDEHLFLGAQLGWTFN